MNKIIRTIVSAVMAAAVTLTSVSALDMPVKSAAADGGTHSHKACGGTAHDGCTHADIVYEEFPTDSKEITISSDKSYYLTRDLSQEDITLINLDNKRLNLCLNGHSIITEKAVFHPVNGEVLNICDCKGGGVIENTTGTPGVVQVTEGGQANLFGGSFNALLTCILSDGSSSVKIYGGQFNSNEPVYMYNGELSIYGGEFTSKKTCITVVAGELSVYGGKFICTAETDTYKYVIDALYGVTVNLYGGELISEKSMGIRLFDSKCVLNMSGGNIDADGAAVSAGNNTNTPEFNISGGSLHSNRAAAVSGGILRMTGGTVSAELMAIVADAEITGGTIKDCTHSGINIQQDRQVTVGGNVRFENNRFDIRLSTADDVFTVGSELQNTVSIRVDDEIREDIPRRITTDGTPESALSKVVSADENYTVKYDDAGGYLYLYNHTHTYDESYLSDDDGHWQICEKCGETSEKAPHDWDDGEVTQEGVKTYTCTVCEAEKTEDINKLPHEHKFSDEWTFDESDHWKVCTVCNTEKSGTAAHSWNAGEITKQPTADMPGEKTFECTVCGKTKTEKIPATDNPTSTPSENDNSDTTPSESTSSSESVTEPSNTTSSGESNHAPSESSPSEDSGNPSTGIAVSLAPLAAALAAAAIIAKRRRK